MTIPIRQVLIPVGGKGTRLLKVNNGYPKPLTPIAGIPILFRALKVLSDQGIVSVILTLFHQVELFPTYEELKLSFPSMEFTLHREEFPNGECGSLWDIKDLLHPVFLFINGDLIFDISINKLMEFHQNTGADLSIVVHPTSHPEDSDTVSAHNGCTINKVSPKISRCYKTEDADYLGNSGIYVVNRDLLLAIAPPENQGVSSFFSHIVTTAFKEGCKIFAYNTSEYIKDVGTPTRFREAELDILKSIPTKKSYRNHQAALFIDRDGPLLHCRKGTYVTSVSQISFNDETILKLADISKSYSCVIVITNQPQISMGLLSLEQFDHINGELIRHSRRLGLLIDEIAYCPHHPHSGFTNELESLKTYCFCRKPQPGMLLMQMVRKNIDLSKSLFVGDTWRDREAALKANVMYTDMQDI